MTNYDLVNSELTKEPQYIHLKPWTNVNMRCGLLMKKQKVSKICDLFNTINRIYIADGHHRMDALSKLSKIKNIKNSNHTGKETYNYFMVAIFPTKSSKIT